MNKGADFSANRKFRYRLWRDWHEDRPTLMVVGLNPSTADENQDDPTIRKCVGFAKQWGYGRLEMLNLFARRATDPRLLIAAAKRGEDVIGPDNDAWLQKIAPSCIKILCAWGNKGHLNMRDEEVADYVLKGHMTKMKMFHRTSLGQPAHPLYIPYAAQMVPYYGRDLSS